MAAHADKAAPTPPTAPTTTPPTPVTKGAALPQTVGANEIMRLTPPAGFVDDVVAYENQRIAYIVADTSTKAELHVVQLGCAKCAEEKKEIVVDLSPVTLRPISLRFVGQGRIFVVGATEEGKQVGALVELAKSPAAPVYKVGPAAHINVMKRDSAQRVVAHFADPTKKGVKHHVEVFVLESGKRLITSKPLELEGAHDKRIDLTVNHWADGWTRAIGTKGGEWVKKENQRSPDTEAVYDVVAGKYIENKPIGDLFEQRKRFQVLADANGQAEFLRMTPDNQSIQVWRGGAMKTVDLDQPLASYDPKSMQGLVNADGTAWIVLKVDPVNADAVARKKADPEYLDIFKLGADGKATRKARILAKGVRHRFGVVGDFFWLLERSTGFDRGGKALIVYSLAS
ncbi:MAG TPA: hypothetical protein VMZ53_13335 [Kofleriaceae bacterium]|nr:hypothetical protein [Kofleriaceae bacterium]